MQITQTVRSSHKLFLTDLKFYTLRVAVIIAFFKGKSSRLIPRGILPFSKKLFSEKHFGLFLTSQSYDFDAIWHHAGAHLGVE